MFYKVLLQNKRNAIDKSDDGLMIYLAGTRYILSGVPSHTYVYVCTCLTSTVSKLILP